MSSTVEVSQNELICKSIPKSLLVLVGAFYLLAFIGVINDQEQDFKIIDYVLFHAVILIIISTQQYIKTTFNKRTNEVDIEKRGIFNHSITKLQLSDIKSVEMSYGQTQLWSFTKKLQLLGYSC